jgi:hypothetical protein
LQTLLTLASCTVGASRIIQVKDVTPLTELATQQPLVLDVIGLSWSNASTAKSNLNIVSSSIDDIMPKLIVAFKDTDAVTLLAFTADTFSKVPPEVSNYALWSNTVITDTLSGSPYGSVMA